MMFTVLKFLHLDPYRDPHLLNKNIRDCIRVPIQIWIPDMTKPNVRESSISLFMSSEL